MNLNFLKESWKNRDTVLWLILLRLIIGIEWFMAGLEKVMSGTTQASAYDVALNEGIKARPVDQSPAATVAGEDDVGRDDVAFANVGPDGAVGQS